MLCAALLTAVSLAADWPNLNEGGKTGYRAPEDVGLVITVEDHGEDDAHLPTIEADGALVVHTLQKARGVKKVRWLREDLTRDAMLKAATKAGKQAKGKGVVWVYVQGFGTLDPVSGDRWIIASDAEDAFTELGLANCAADPADPLGQAARAGVREHVVSVAELRDAAAAGGHPVVMVVETVPAPMDCTLHGLGGSAKQIPREPLPAPNTLVWTDRGGRAQGWSIVQWSVGHMGMTYLFAAVLRGWPDGFLDDKLSGRVTPAEATAWVDAAARAFTSADWSPMMPQAQSGFPEDVPLAVGSLEPLPAGVVPVKRKAAPTVLP